MYVYKYLQCHFLLSLLLYFPVSCVSFSVTATVKRVGGGYGGKISRSAHIAAACALGSYATGRLVRLACYSEYTYIILVCMHTCKYYIHHGIEISCIVL